jgi:hypothetical protein
MLSEGGTPKISEIEGIEGELRILVGGLGPLYLHEDSGHVFEGIEEGGPRE